MTDTSPKSKPSIHFVLPGGGVKGCFQAGFLYQLFTSYRNNFSVSRIDGTSVGALNGFAVSHGNIQGISDTWQNIKTIDDIFSGGTTLPFLDSLAKGYRFYSQYSVYNNDKLEDIIECVKNTPGESGAPGAPKLIDKFNCVVTSVRSGSYKYVNGTNQSIDKYVLASASPWIVSPPIEIDNELYTDGGLLQTIPSDFIGKIDADITLVIGYDLNCENLGGNEGNSALSYISRLIDITRLNHHNICQFKAFIGKQTQNIQIIDNPLKLGFLDFNEAEMKRGFELGKGAADTFVVENKLI